jgi:L-seryl-tRNA(Ser) seleniumtransferase
LSASAIERVAAVARGYSSLEYDLARGGRGRRDLHAEALLCRLTGAEAAVVVNNNAAATLLVLAALAAGREVIVSRGELVEIGGGFRIPDVMAQSGAILREVGTTNRTRGTDLAAAINERTVLLLRVHPSNFRIEGFTERPSLTDYVTLGKRFNVPVAEDLGSGGGVGDVTRQMPSVVFVPGQRDEAKGQSRHAKHMTAEVRSRR